MRGEVWLVIVLILLTGSWTLRVDAAKRAAPSKFCGGVQDLIKDQSMGFRWVVCMGLWPFDPPKTLFEVRVRPFVLLLLAIALTKSCVGATAIPNASLFPFRAKLTHVSPVWYQLRRAKDAQVDSSKEWVLVGGHEYNETWINSVRQPGGMQESCVAVEEVAEASCSATNVGLSTHWRTD
eukprot:1140769-Pelagomonas_calceolata.AAC.1